MKYYKEIIIVILLVILFIGGGIYSSSNVKYKKKYELEVNLKNALQDTLKTYKNKEGEWVSEKKTLQVEIETFEDSTLNLNDTQKKLITKVTKLKKEKDIISAAYYKQKIVIDSLLNNIPKIDTINNKIEFEKTSDSLNYHMTITNVKPIVNKTPQLLIDKLEIPIETFVEFHWDKDKTKPVGFSVRTKNPLIKTESVESYIIPEVRKEDIKPTGWQKFKKWFGKSGKKVGIFVGGAIVGGLIVSSSK